MADEKIIIDGRYEILKTIGRGTMGLVYLAKDIDLGRSAAVKVIAPEIASDQNTVSRFRREAAALASIRNEHVVQIYTFGPYKNTFYFAMEYLKGRSLETVLEKYNALGMQIPMPNAVPLVRQLASGLAAVHAANIVHRDIKPGNVVIEDDTGRPVFIDFGLARRTDGAQFRTSIQAGTPSYVAPEQVSSASGALLSAATDQYAFGCTMYEIFTGNIPFDGATVYDIIEKHITAPIPKPSLVRSELAPFDHIVMRALSKDPADRYPSVSALRADLDSAAGPYLTGDTRALAVDPVAAPVKRSGLRVLIVAKDIEIARGIRRGVQLALFRKEISVSITPTIDEALVNASRQPPELVIIAHETGATDAVRFVSGLRAQKPAPTGEIVAVTSAPHIKTELGALQVKHFLDPTASLPLVASTFQQIATSRGWITPESDQSDED